MSDALVKFRNPFPPHEVLLSTQASNVTYGSLLLRPGTAGFNLSRVDPHIANFARLLRVGMMVTIERTDGLYPFVGFVTKRIATRSDPEIQFVCQDHTWLLGRARTRKNGIIRAASGNIIVDAFNEMESRAEPPTLVRLDRVTGGPALEYQYQLRSALDFLNQMTDFTDWEWGFAYEITDQKLVTYLTWDFRRGIDRRFEVVWEENIQLEDVTYTQDAEGFIGSSVVVGGDGAFAERSAASVNRRGASNENIGGRPLARQPVELAPALSGTRILIDHQILPGESLFAAASRLHDTPEHVGEQLSFSVVEQNIDMQALGVGDIVTTRLADANLGISMERYVRILGVKFNPEAGVHDIEAQVLAEE